MEQYTVFGRLEEIRGPVLPFSEYSRLHLLSRNEVSAYRIAIQPLKYSPAINDENTQEPVEEETGMFYATIYKSVPSTLLGNPVCFTEMKKTNCETTSITQVLTHHGEKIVDITVKFKDAEKQQ